MTEKPLKTRQTVHMLSRTKAFSKDFVVKYFSSSLFFFFLIIISAQSKHPTGPVDGRAESIVYTTIRMHASLFFFPYTPFARIDRAFHRVPLEKVPDDVNNRNHHNQSVIPPDRLCMTRWFSARASRTSHGLQNRRYTRI